MRAVKLIENCIWVKNVQETIPEDHLWILEEGPKTVGMDVPGRPQTTEQSMTHSPVYTPSKGTLLRDLNMVEYSNLVKPMLPTTEACDSLSWL